MSAKGVHKITEDFERKVAEYTGAPYCVAVDSGSNALFLCLKYVIKNNDVITIPSHTYPSVPCEIIHAGGRVNFEDSPKHLTGSYRLKPTNIWDSALSFTNNMFIKGSLMCLSFTGPFKRLKLSKGGAILTDDIEFVKWAKRKRFSGRSECSYFEEKNFDLGWNFYMPPEIAARGLLLLSEFYNSDLTPKDMPDITLEYPDLPKHKIYKENWNKNELG